MKTVVRYSKNFQKQYRKAGPKIQSAFAHRRKLFQKNHHHPLLHNHSLRGKYRGLRSINITGDWRALYREKQNSRSQVCQEYIIFELLSTHSQLYK
jgi:addiction module RelE/StbE family toxin